jgi:hypothetical protein
MTYNKAKKRISSKRDSLNIKLYMNYLVSVMVGFVGTVNGYPDIIGLFLC